MDWSDHKPNNDVCLDVSLELFMNHDFSNTGS